MPRFPIKVVTSAATVVKGTRAAIRFLRNMSSKRWRQVGLTVFALLTAGPVGFLVSDVYNRHAWERYEAQQQAKDERLYLSNFPQEEVLDEDNFAALPILKNISLAAEGQRVNERPFQLPDVSCPRRAIPEIGYRFDAKKWRTILAERGLIDTPSEDIANDLLLALVPHEKTLAELSQGCVRSKMKLAGEWQPRPPAGTVAQISKLHSAASVAAFRANAYLAAGDGQSALADLRLLAALRDRLSSSGGLHARTSFLGIGTGEVAVIFEGLSRHAWDESQLREIASILTWREPLADLAEMWELERALANYWYDWILHGNYSTSSERLTFDPDSWFTNTRVLRTFPGILRRNQLRTNQYFTAKRDRYDASRDLLLPEGRSPHISGAYYTILHLMLQNSFGYERCSILLSAKFRLASAACALERYYLIHSIYPSDLSSLVPTFLPSVPHEPLSLDPLIYYPLTTVVIASIREVRIWKTTVGFSVADELRPKVTVLRDTRTTTGHGRHHLRVRRRMGAVVRSLCCSPLARSVTLK